MADRADLGRMLLAVAIDAVLHLDRTKKLDLRLLPHITVAGGTLRLRLDVYGVAEKDKVGEFVDALRGNLGGVVFVTGMALGDGRKSGAILGNRTGVAGCAGHFQRGMRLVRKGRIRRTK